MSTKPKMATRPLRLICLDGGGVHSISELVMLEAIMVRVQEILKLKDTPRPSDYFDLIGGTSTGGLIAIMLGRLHMTVAESLEAYTQLSEALFSNQASAAKGSRLGSKKFKRIFKSLVKAKLGDGDAPLREAGDDVPCRSFVCTVSTDKEPHVRLVRSYQVPDMLDDDCSVWEAARATCASPKHFKRVTLGTEDQREECFDGSISGNNPISELCKEVIRVFHPSQDVGCIVSLGTGFASAVEATGLESSLFSERVLPLSVVQGFQKLASESKFAVQRLQKRLGDTVDLYYRLNTDHDLQSFDGPESDDICEIRKATATYLNSKPILDIIDSIATKIAGTNGTVASKSYTLSSLALSDEDIAPTLVQRKLSFLQHPGQTQSTLSSKDSLIKKLRNWLLPSRTPSFDPAQDQKLAQQQRFISKDGIFRTCDWIFKTRQYQRFITTESASALWIKGPPGCGKTVLLSAMIQHLDETASARKSHQVLYYYARCEPDPDTSMDVVRSFLAQVLLWNDDEIIQKLEKLYLKQPVLKDYGTQSEPELWTALENILLTTERKVYVILDALNNCAQPLLRHLLSIATQRRGGKAPSLLLSSHFDMRHDFELKHIQKMAKKLAWVQQFDITPDKTVDDLAQFVTYRVNDEDSVFQKSSEKIRNEVINRVCERATGMFLYANMVLEELKGDNISSVGAIKRTLDDLPSELFGFYERKLTKVRRSQRGADILCWMFGAMRNLSWKELNSGLAIIDGTFKEEEMIEDNCEVFIDLSCGQLVEVFGSERDRLRFIHPTVKEFLAKSDGPGASLGIPDSHSRIASKLLTFLQYPDLPEVIASDENRWQETVESYSERPGRGIYSYAVFNWYRHLKECSKAPDTQLEVQLLDFLDSATSVRWLKNALVMAKFSRDGVDSVSLTVDVIDSLQSWMQGRTWATNSSLELRVQAWTKDFLDIMDDWGKVLEDRPYWIHFIPQQLLSATNKFRQLTDGGEDHAAISFGEKSPQTKSTENAKWSENCFALDLDRDLAYSFEENYFYCHHVRTGLLTAEFELTGLSQEGSRLQLKRGFFSPNKKFLATVFEVVSDLETDVAENVRSGLRLVLSSTLEWPPLAWKAEIEAVVDETEFLSRCFGIKQNAFVICLLELQYTGLARRNLFKIPDFLTSPLASRFLQSPRWRVDDLDNVAFSKESDYIVLPFGRLNLSTGRMDIKWRILGEAGVKGGKSAEDGTIMAFVRDRQSIELFNTRTQDIDKRIQFSKYVHILAISNQSRFLLLLQVEATTKSGRATSRKNTTGQRFQQGTIGIYDCKNALWTALLSLRPPDCRNRACWAVTDNNKWLAFGSEAVLPNETNKVMVQVPAGWKLATQIKTGRIADKAAAFKEAQLLIFEAERYKDGFGTAPTLKCRLNAPLSESLKILSWSSHFDEAMIYAANLITPTRIEAIEPIELATPEGKEFIGDTSVAIDTAGVVRSFRVFFTSYDRLSLYRVQVSVTILAGTSKLEQYLQVLGPSSELQYNISITLFNNEESIPQLYDFQYITSPETYSPPFRSQLISALDGRQLSLGGLEVQIGEDENASPLAIAAGESLHVRALEIFQRRAHPLPSPNSSSAIVELDKSKTGTHYAIFGNEIVSFSNIPKQVEAFVSSTFLEDKSFAVISAATQQEGIHLFQFTRLLSTPAPNKASEQPEAQRFEVFICIYDDDQESITWFTHTTTAGFIAPSFTESPVAAWALHPTLPLLAWMLPGHKLRISRIDSSDPPVNITGSLTIEVPATQAFRFSPNGRYLLLQASDSFVNDLLSWGQKSDRRTIKVCDLEIGKTVTLSLSSLQNLSFDIDDESLKVYRLNKLGAVEMSIYSLPNLESVDREYLTFIPAKCGCASCGKLFETECHIAVIENQGDRCVVLGHSPISIGVAKLAVEECEPLILRITSSETSVDISMAETLNTSRVTTSFPPMLNSDGDIASDVCKTLIRLNAISENREAKENLMNHLRKESAASVLEITQSISIFNNFEYDLGKIDDVVDRVDIEKITNKVEVMMEKATSFTGLKEQLTKSFTEGSSLVFEAMGDFLPFSNWDEYKEMMAELGEDTSAKNMFGDLFGKTAGMGCKLPLLFHTFYFPETGFETSSTKYSWSSSADTGWIEEDVALFFQRFFDDDFDGARQFYPFTMYDNMMQDRPDPIGDLKKRIQLRTQRKADKNKAGETYDEDYDDNPLFLMQDALDALSDILPGLGKLMQVRMRDMMSQSFIQEADEL